jgi:methyl-accepting chemotaxis protein/methyl-accepting chemotaxis protein-1 (serine sensor receptor)
MYTTPAGFPWKTIREPTSTSIPLLKLDRREPDGMACGSSGIDQISRAIVQMEQVTQSSAANAEQSAAAAEQLNVQAEHMKDVVETMRAMVDGGEGMRRGTDTHTRGRIAAGSAQWSPM